MGGVYSSEECVEEGDAGDEGEEDEGGGEGGGEGVVVLGVDFADVAGGLGESVIVRRGREGSL